MDKIWTWHRVESLTGKKIKFYEQRELLNYIDTLPDTGEAIFRKAKSKRSKNQREYYWAVIVKIIAEWMGEEKDSVNEILKQRFNPKPAKDFSGNPIMIGGSIEKESVQDVEKIYEEIRIYFASEHNLIIPLPNEVDYE